MKYFYERYRFHIILISVLIFIFVIVPVGNLIFNDSPIVFNQHFQEKAIGNYDGFSLSEKIPILISRYSYGFNLAFLSKRGDVSDFEEAVKIGDVKDAFSSIYREVPFYSIVYPTEGYYYYNINLSESVFSGNIRLTDAAEGKVSFAYFQVRNSSNSLSSDFGKENGFFIKKISKNHYFAFYEGKLVLFRAFQDAVREAPKELSLLPGEEFIVVDHDESGIYFYLIYNNENKSFYYILDESRPLLEEYESLGKGLVVGNRTGFVFYNDSENNRMLLVGVDSFNIMYNNYYDGPFDQVFPFLDNRDRLYASYPYTRYLHGLDQYGNFNDWEGSRVAISSYFNYWADPYETLEVLDSCENLSEDLTLFYSCLTYESKRDFHKEQPEVFYEDGRVREKYLLPDDFNN